MRIITFASLLFATLGAGSPFASSSHSQNGSADDYYHGPQKSPDGKWVAYTKVSRFDHPVNGDDIATISLCVRNRKTGRIRRLVSAPGRNNVPVTAGWSPDSKRVLYWSLYDFGSGSINADGSGLFDISIQGGAPRNLEHEYHIIRGFRCGGVRRKQGSFVFSPDGKYLLVVNGGLRFLVTDKRISRIEYSTGKQMWLSGTNEAALMPSWSPDGTEIAYISTPDDHPLGETSDNARRWANLHLWVMRSDGTHKRQLRSDRRYHEAIPTWVGNRIHFRRFEGNFPETYTKWSIRSDGSSARRISPRAFPVDD